MDERIQTLNRSVMWERTDEFHCKTEVLSRNGRRDEFKRTMEAYHRNELT